VEWLAIGMVRLEKKLGEDDYILLGSTMFGEGN
jgi:hypothetical protein